MYLSILFRHFGKNHESHKDHKCEACDKSFSQTSTLESSHILTVHCNQETKVNIMKPRIRPKKKNSSKNESIKSSESYFDNESKNVANNIKMVNESSNPSKNIPKIAEKVTKNDSDIEIIDDLNIKVDKEAQKKDIFICNCKKEDQHMSTHYCEECDEGFCRFCVKAHQRFLKVTQVHNLLQINYYCKCQTEEKNICYQILP